MEPRFSAFLMILAVFLKGSSIISQEFKASGQYREAISSLFSLLWETERSVVVMACSWRENTLHTFYI